MRVSLSDLKTVATKALHTYGYTDEETAVILDVLLYSQLRGGNQGLVKLVGNGLPKANNAGEIEIVKETKLSALLNGNHNNGMVVMKRAVEMAVEKTKEHGFGIVGTNNTNTSTGSIGYYARQIADKGFVGFVFAGSPETVAAHGSYEPIFGTNPLAIGIPSSQSPLILDMATAAMAFYGLIEASIAGKKIPGDIAYDKEGNLTNDPDAAMDGALRPFDKSYKGSDLSLMVEVLTGPLVGASFVGFGDTAANWGNLVYAIDPEILVDANTFKENVAQLAEKVRQTKKLPDVEEIFVPGERGDRIMQQALASGTIEIEDNLYTQLQQVADR